MSLRETILTKTPQLAKLTVPEWDRDIYVPRLSPGARVALLKRTGTLEEIPEKDAEGRGRWLARYFIAVACDQTGTPLFSAEDEEDVYAHAIATAVEAVALFALRINSVGRERLESLGNVSGEARNGASPTGSLATSG